MKDLIYYIANDVYSGISRTKALGASELIAAVSTGYWEGPLLFAMSIFSPSEDGNARPPCLILRVIQYQRAHLDALPAPSVGRSLWVHKGRVHTPCAHHNQHAALRAQHPAIVDLHSDMPFASDAAESHILTIHTSSGICPPR